MIKLVLKTIERDKDSFDYFELYCGGELISHYIDVKNISVVVCKSIGRLLVTFFESNLSHSIWVTELENRTYTNIEYKNSEEM